MKRLLLVGALVLMSLGNLLGQAGEMPPHDPLHLIVKLKSADYLQRGGSEQFFRDFPIDTWKPVLPQQRFLKGGKPSVLNGIFKVKVKKSVNDLQELIRQLSANPDVLYAEPIYYDYPLRIPNDPLANPTSGSQYYLSLINAFDAWDISTADAAIRIAVLDTGVDPDHEDLGNRWVNEEDPVNGIDDDGNGFIDDFSGWDFADGDNDPTADQSDHGLRVTGVSNAEVDNAVGMAGVGYNASYVPIKIFSSENGVSGNAYDAIMYAAMEGFEVLNLSWGSPNSFSQYRQEIINFATVEMGAVVVAAAGNTPEELDFYPASYDNVLSVASTDASDAKSDFSTYGLRVDLAAPGSDIVSSGENNSYRGSSGTSFASPQVAGAAALLKSLRPDWTNFQIMEQLRVTTDPIDDLPANQSFAGMLGSGRLNVLSALTTTDAKSVRVTDFSINNTLGAFAYFGDTVTVEVGLQNYLNEVEELAVTANSSGEFVELIDATVNIGQFDTLATDSVSFRFVLSDETPNEEAVVLGFDFRGEGYEDRQFISFNTSPDRLDFGVGQSFLTTNSTLEMGHESNLVGEGIGFRWNGSRVLESIGLMIGESENTLVNNAMTDVTTLQRDDDFVGQSRLKPYAHPAVDLFASGDVTTATSANNDLEITHQYYGWSEGKEASNIVLELIVTNTSASDREEVRLGLFANWDINSAVSNVSGWQADDSIAFAFDLNTAVYTGMASLNTELEVVYNSIDVSQRISTFQTAVSDAEKFQLLSEFNGDSLIDTDILQTLSVNIPALASQESIKLAFVLTAADSYDDIKTQADRAKAQYFQEVLQNPRIIRFATTCQGGNVLLQPGDGENYLFYNDPLGTTSLAEGSGLELTGLESDTLVYFRSFAENGRLGEVFAYQVEVIPIDAKFSFDPDTVLLGAANSVQLTNETAFTESVRWDLGNGLLTEIENPSTVYDQEGVYQVQLEVTSVFGCVDVTTRDLVVLNRNPIPQFTVLTDTLCMGQSVSLSAINSDSINVYADPQQLNRLFSGGAFEIGSVLENTSLYITNVDGPYESNVVQYQLLIDDFEPIWFAVPDTTNLSETGVFFQSLDAGFRSDFQWTVGGEAISDHFRVRYDLEEVAPGDLTVVHNARNERGCEGESTQTLMLASSSLPSFPSQQICAGANLLIKPTNGQYFSFYTDPVSTEAVHKGTSLLLQQIDRDTVIYVRGLDGFLEGPTEVVTLIIEDFEVQIEASQTEFVLGQQALSVDFEAVGEIVSYSWFVNDVLVDVTPAPVLFFDSVGEYQIRLEAFNNNRCLAVAETVITVSAPPVVTSVEANNEFPVYPNPTSDLLHFDNKTVAIEVLTLSGQLMMRQELTDGLVSLKSFQNGIYLVRAFTREGDLQLHKVIVRK